MREILFRGKYINTGEWVMGDLIREPFGTCIQAVTEFGNGYARKKYLIEPESICQYTGLVDKNGVKIFESDIVEAWSDGLCAKGEVKLREDGLWIFYPAYQHETFWRIWPSNHTVEVIGNIFDDPELLDGKN